MRDAELRNAIRSMTSYQTFEYFGVNSPNDGSAYIVQTIGPFGSVVDRRTVFVKTICEMGLEKW